MVVSHYAPVLKELMRQASIDTRLKFYVGKNAHTTADAVWAAFEANQTDSCTNHGTTGQETQNRAST